MLPTHTIICSSNPQRPRGGRRCGGKMLWFVKTQTTEKGETKMITVNEQQAFSIYPNPASTFITIAYRNSTDGYFKLFNTLGQVVMETQLSAMNTKVQLLLTDVANGLYHYDISFLDGQQTQGKLLIQKK